MWLLYNADVYICGDKMPTRCNRGFYCRSYCLLNMFQAPLFPSSGAQEYYTVVAACGISCCGFQVAGLVWSWGLCVRFAGCCFLENLKIDNQSTKYLRQQPLYNTLELLMMGKVVPETCWASNKICRMLQTGRVALGSTPEQQLENHSTKYHRQQPLYNTFELLMMGIVMPETCWASNKICNKNLCCI